MTLKSNIDWNEIIPLLPRAKREELYLEAVTLLSQDDRENEPVKRRRRSVKKMVAPLRVWKEQGIPGDLSVAGRKYKINKESKVQIIAESSLGKLWELVKNSHNDTI